MFMCCFMHCKVCVMILILGEEMIAWTICFFDGCAWFEVWENELYRCERLAIFLKNLFAFAFFIISLKWQILTLEKYFLFLYLCSNQINFCVGKWWYRGQIFLCLRNLNNQCCWYEGHQFHCWKRWSLKKI